jgi:ABC-type multidrug transport system fused ATPase/permease subunit
MAVGVVNCVASVISIIVLVASIIPQFLIVALAISVVYAIVGKLYINASRELKRLEAIQRSPLFQHLGETISGAVTIRAYGAEARLARKNLKTLDDYTRPYNYLWATNRWLAFRVDFFGTLVSVCTAATLVLCASRLSAGAAGLAMTYAVTFTDNILWFVRLYAFNEQNMTSIERMEEYCHIKGEAPAVIANSKLPADWPEQGEVEFRSYATKYRKDLDFTLFDVSFNLQAGEKLGVADRTGSGKTSLAMSLFRALEAEEGQILVDDVDISNLGLRDLRGNVVMVPQGMRNLSGLKTVYVLMQHSQIHHSSAEQSGAT